MPAVIHSDTLYSAIFSLWATLFNDDIDEMAADNLFGVSSLYPFYVVSGKVIHFMPIPLGCAPESSPGSPLANLRLISSELLIPFCRGQRLPLESYSIFHNGAACCQEEVTRDALFFECGLQTRTTVDRAASVHTVDSGKTELSFSQRSGLFFLAWFHDGDVKKKFESVLALLADEGLGRARSLGRGTFEITQGKQFELPRGGGENHLCLSLFSPETGESAPCIDYAKSSYGLLSRRGVAPTSAGIMPTKSVAMITEGSLLHFNRKVAIGGRSRDISIENSLLGHKQYRVGRSLFVPTDI